MENSGIYKIVSIVNNKKVYIGSAVNLKKRRNEHIRRLKSAMHPNKILLNHVKKYGIEDLEFIVIERCKKDKLIEREQYYIDTINPFFNICKIAGSTLGRPQSKETRKKRSVALKNRILSDETKQAMRNAAIRRIKQPKEVNGFVNIKRIGANHNNISVYLWKCNKCYYQIQTTIGNIKSRKYPNYCCSTPIKEKKVKVLKNKNEYKKPYNPTGYIGISRRNDKGAYIARVSTKEAKQKFIGYYLTAIEAAIARDKYILEHSIDAALNNVTN